MMSPQPSVLRNWYALPIWARTRRTAAVLPVVLLVLGIPSLADARGSGGVPGPDPSTQIAPDPAPSGGEFGFHGTGGQTPPQQGSTPTTPRGTPSTPSTSPVSSSGPAQVAPAGTAHRATTAKHRARHHHAAATHRGAHKAARALHVRVAAARRVPGIFAASLDLDLGAPFSPAEVAAGDSGDALVLAAVALLLFVFAGLMVVRRSAEALQRERPA